MAINWPLKWCRQRKEILLSFIIAAIHPQVFGGVLVAPPSGVSSPRNRHRHCDVYMRRRREVEKIIHCTWMGINEAPKCKDLPQLQSLHWPLMHFYLRLEVAIVAGVEWKTIGHEPVAAWANFSNHQLAQTSCRCQVIGYKLIDVLPATRLQVGRL